FGKIEIYWLAERLMLDVGRQRLLVVGIELVGLEPHVLDAALVDPELNIDGALGIRIPLGIMRSDAGHGFGRIAVAGRARLAGRAFDRVPDLLAPLDVKHARVLEGISLQLPRLRLAEQPAREN